MKGFRKWDTSNCSVLGATRNGTTTLTAMVMFAAANCGLLSRTCMKKARVVLKEK
jgi:hypothetical protein